MATIVHVGYRPGCIHRILELHEDYYSRESGFGKSFELKIANDLSEFMARYNEETDLLLLGLVEGTLEGSLVIDGAKAEQHGAHLRWFIVSDAVRGKGLGKMLMDRAMAFIKMRGYKSAYLWTFAELAAARHIYMKYGFRLARQLRGNRWGKDVDEQMYVNGKDLAPK
jgi:GNAT superfamily N-acetyltransferase